MNCLGMSGRRLAASLATSRTTPIRLLVGRHARCLAGTRCVRVGIIAGSHHRRLDDDNLCKRTFHASPTHHQSADDFALRAKQFGLASKEEVALAARDPSAVFLDVRSPPEIEDAPLTTTGSSRPCVEIWCTMDDTSRLVEQVEQRIPNKDGEF